jgi:hypothetical protein
VNPGAPAGAPGFHRPLMKNLTTPERAVALMHEALEVMLRVGQAPDSPVYAFVTAEKRRQLRRDAKRLRKQQTEPRYRNLHSAEELADLYERTARRDEIREQGQRDLHRISAELKRIRREKDAEVEKAVKTLLYESARSAIEHGPGSEADRRHRLLHYWWWFGGRVLAHRRKPQVPYSGLFPPTRDLSIQPRMELTAAEILDSPPPGEAVIAIPPEGSGSGRERAYIRIGLGEASWVGSFEIGYTKFGSFSLMPDNKHLFVSAKGAGYIIDLKTRTLVERIGTHVAFVWTDAERTLFTVDHNGMSLESFDKNGRLWKTDTISSGGFREMSLEDGIIAGEAQRGPGEGWVGFSVEVATGEVRFEDGG